jgi:hypothetical protein
MIMDLYLADGDRAIAAPDALTAYEAHRAEDQLMIVVNHYILNQPKEARASLGQVKLSRLIASARVQRIRLSILFMLMQVLARLPRIALFADLFHARWHAKRKAKTDAFSPR